MQTNYYDVVLNTTIRTTSENIDDLKVVHGFDMPVSFVVYEGEKRVKVIVNAEIIED